MIGELDHPSDAKIHLEKASHIITNLEMTPTGEVIGEAEVLSTPTGVILQELLKANIKLGISSRGFGSLKPKDKGLQEVQEDYKLVTFDIVSDPSTPGAFPDPVYEQKLINNNNNDKDIYVNDLESLVSAVLDEDIDKDFDERKYFICTDDYDTRFYIVEGEKESYGNLTFHASHDYHILVKNQTFTERLGINEENIYLIEKVYNENVKNKILEKIEELGYDPYSLFLKNKED